MSRGFVREDDQEEPVFVAPRATLPPGMMNHVTPRGFSLLLAERERREAERGAVKGADEMARRRELAEITGALDLLNERIASARVVELDQRPMDVVRFGASVTFVVASGPQQGVERKFTLVGVDEASVADGRIAFIAPIAQALLGKRVGEIAEFHLGAMVQRLKVTVIS